MKTPNIDIIYTMKLSTVFLGVFATVSLTRGITVPEAEPEALALPEAEAEPVELEKRACTPLTRAQCQASSATKYSGVYCAYCFEVLGTHWSSHKDWAYQLNKNDGSCCTYGVRNSCKGDPATIRKTECPV